MRIGSNWRTSRVSGIAIFLFLGMSVTGLPLRVASAFTEKEVQGVFAVLDANKTGKVDRPEYDENKVAAMFFPAPPQGTTNFGDLMFEQTKFNRAFFDAADTDHKGKLDPVDLIYALDFDKIDTDHKGITIDDLRRFMKKVGR